MYCLLVGDVEQLPDLLGCLTLDHVGDGLAADVTQLSAGSLRYKG